MNLSLPSPHPALFTPFRFFPGERDVFRRKEPLTVSEWAEKNRMVTIGAHVGPWRNSITPYLVDIMDTFSAPWVREIIIVKSPQTGGTETILNCLGYAIDRTPGPIMYVMPGRDTAKKTTEQRIIPMLQSSPQLRPLISDNPDDTTKTFIKLSTCDIYLAWSNSAATLASFPIKVLITDEEEKYPDTVGKETDTVTLAKKRLRTFRHTSKHLRASTPTRESGPIWQAWLDADVQKKFAAVCPDCGRGQIMMPDRLRYPADISPEAIKRSRLAFYACEECGSAWDDQKRDIAVKTGRWVVTKGADIDRPRSVAYHPTSFISPDVSLSEIACAHKKMKADVSLTKKDTIDFYNDYLAEPYIEKQSERKEDAILALRDDRPRGMVPRDISCLMLLVDAQARGFFYEVKAYGWGQSLPMWQVREGYVESFEDLKQIAYHDEYLDADNVSHKIDMAFIDSGGGLGKVPKHSRTAEVYVFCRQNPMFKALKGRQIMTKLWDVTQIDYLPGSKKPIPGGLKLYLLNVTLLKNYLATKLQVNPNDPGAWHLHSEATEDYARMMCAEYQDNKGHWDCPPSRANHYWDINVYAIAAAEIRQIRFWKKPSDTHAQEKKTSIRKILSRGIQK